MNLINIKENTYYIKGGTNSGIYLFQDGTALIIDPGLIGLRFKRIIKELENNNIKLKFIVNTHEHIDHYGSALQFKMKDPSIKILASKDAKLYIENEDLFSKYIVGGKSNKFFDEFFYNSSKYNYEQKLKVDEVLQEGTLYLNNEKFKIIEFKGHTPGSIGIMTKDRVLFIGDLLVGKEMLNKYDFLFIYDINEYLKSLEKLKMIDFKYIVLGHSKDILTKEESYELIENHKKSIYKYLNQIIMELKEPKIGRAHV